jgi:aspartate aminotransferase-like enzyme
MDLYDQWVYMQKTTQWRYTPPTHVVAAFDEAIRQFLEEGGLAARGARYAKNCRELVAGMQALGFRPFLPAAIQAPIIVTFHAPGDRPTTSRTSTPGEVARLHPLSASSRRSDLPRRLHRRST